MSKKGLTPRQQSFISYYLVHLNATKAAALAGYSAKTSKSQGQRLLTNVDIKKAIGDATQKVAEQNKLTKQMIIDELKLVAFSNMGNYAKWGKSGITLKDSEELDLQKKAAVSEITENITKKGVTTKIKLHDKVKSLITLGQHLGMFGDGKTRSDDPETDKAVVRERLLDFADKFVGEKSA